MSPSIRAREGRGKKKERRSGILHRGGCGEGGDPAPEDHGDPVHPAGCRQILTAAESHGARTGKALRQFHLGSLSDTRFVEILWICPLPPKLCFSLTELTLLRVTTVRLSAMMA